MPKQTINIGTSDLAGDGESLRSAWDKVNDNFDEVYSDIVTLNDSKIVYSDLSVTTASASGSGSLTYNDSTGIFTFTPAASAAETNDLTSAVTWTNIPDAYVPQSAVTQHQAALTITQSQISDLSNFSGDYNDLTNKPSGLYNLESPYVGNVIAVDSGIYFNPDETGNTYSGQIYGTSDGRLVISSSRELFVQAILNRGNILYLHSITDPEDNIGTAGYIWSGSSNNLLVSAGGGGKILYLQGNSLEITTDAVPGYGTPKNWKFNNTGTITFPDTTTQSTAWTGTVTESQISDLQNYSLNPSVVTYSCSVTIVGTSQGDADPANINDNIHKEILIITNNLGDVGRAQLPNITTIGKIVFVTANGNVHVDHTDNRLGTRSTQLSDKQSAMYIWMGAGWSVWPSI